MAGDKPKFAKINKG